jgi:hypothetical protein
MKKGVDKLFMANFELFLYCVVSRLLRLERQQKGFGQDMAWHGMAGVILGFMSRRFGGFVFACLVAYWLISV